MRFWLSLIQHWSLTQKRTDLSSVLVSDEIYSDSNKGSRAGNEKLTKYFKTTDSIEISRQILLKGELSLTTDQRRRMVEEKGNRLFNILTKVLLILDTCPSSTN